MSWLTDLIDRNLALALSAGDRAQLADLIEDAFPREELVDAIRTSALAVLNVRKLRGELAPHADIESIASELARNCAAGAQGVLYLESDEIADRTTAETLEEAVRQYTLTVQRLAKEASADLLIAARLENARQAGSLALARIRHYQAEQECTELVGKVAALEAEVAMLRGGAKAVA
jgi:hypothetical protein